MKPRTKLTRSLFGSLAATASSLKVDGTAILSEVAMDLFESLDTPVALSCAILLRYGEIPALVGKSIHPRDYNSPSQYADDYQAVSFLRKAPFIHEGLDPKAEAKKKFFEAEAQCKETNSRVRPFLTAPRGVSSTVINAMCIARDKIREVLGDSVSSVEWIHSCRFGPGSFNHPGARGLTSVYDKLQVPPSVTYDFWEPGATLVMSSPAWSRSLTGIEVDGFWPFVSKTDLIPVPGNRVTFVPKTATTERAIAIEPLVNIYAQLGLGSMIRKRLRAFADIDLDDQSVNQQLAREGSIRGFFVTIDLSSASDTVAREVVRLLLPEGWFRAMDICRSKVGEIDGQVLRYEKFSSMGNGFTFELESLLFWALSFAACVISDSPTMVSVYGDDIIVPRSAYETLNEVLVFFGFTMNSRKTFYEGPFRESCGKDYYEGTDVRPFLQKEIPNDLRGLFCLANGIRRRAWRSSGSSFGCDRRYRRAYRRVLSGIPNVIRSHCLVPAHAGDSDGLVSDWDTAVQSPLVTQRNGWEGWHGVRLAPVPNGIPLSTNFEGGVASLLYRAKDGFENDFSPSDPRRGREVRFEVKYGAFYGPWTDLGDWDS